MVHNGTGQFLATVGVKAMNFDPQMGKCSAGLQTPTKIFRNRMAVYCFSCHLSEIMTLNWVQGLLWEMHGESQDLEKSFTGVLLCLRHTVAYLLAKKCGIIKEQTR